LKKIIKKGPALTSYVKAAKKGSDAVRRKKPKIKGPSPPPKEGHRVIIQTGVEKEKKRINKLSIKKILD
jgi:hypothetical protein